jgi:hypothetical protein
MVCQPYISVFFHRSLCSWLVTLHIAWICRLRPTSRINEIRPGSSIVVDFGIANHPRAHFLHISKLYHVRRDVSRFAVFVSEKKIGNLQIGSISDVARDITKSKSRWVFCLHGPRPARPWKTYAWCLWWMCDVRKVSSTDARIRVVVLLRNCQRKWKRKRKCSRTRGVASKACKTKCASTYLNPEIVATLHQSALSHPEALKHTAFSKPCYILFGV